MASRLIGRCADVYDIDLALGDQVAKRTTGHRDLVPAGKIENMVSPRRDGSDLDIDAVDASVSMHMQLRNEAATHQTDPDFRHRGRLRPSLIRVRLSQNRILEHS
jgi:hypothetical protein